MRPKTSPTPFFKQLKQIAGEVIRGLTEPRGSFALPADAESQQALKAGCASLVSDFWPFGPYDNVLVEDTSTSMDGTDFYPSRLEGAKEAAGHFIRLRARFSPKDRVAIVAFTETAEVILPFTSITQTATIINKLKTLEPSDGTDIAEGLKVTKSLFLASSAEYARKPRF